jgi:hypothetical protein
MTMSPIPRQNSPARRSSTFDGHRIVAIILFLLITLGCVLLSSQVALITIDRSFIPEGIAARQIADYGPGPSIEIMPVDRDRILEEIIADDAALRLTGAGFGDFVEIAQLPEVSPNTPTVTPTPTPVPFPSTPVTRVTAPAGTPSSVQPPSQPEDASPTAGPDSTDAPPTARPQPPTTTPPVPSATVPPSPTVFPSATLLPSPTLLPTASPTVEPSPTSTSEPEDPATAIPTMVLSPTVTTVPDNRPPDASDDSVTVNEDGSVAIDVLLNDPDPDGDALNLTSLVVIGGPAHGGTTVAGAQIIYTPDTDYFGPDTFTYRICDVLGACNTASVTILVNGTPDPPRALSDVATTAEDNAVAVSVLNNDTDPDGVVPTISSVGAAASGDVVQSGDQLIYTPAPNFFGQDVFTYTITDGSSTDTAAVTVTVTPVNDAPVAVNDAASTAEDTDEDIPVLLNDTDIEGDSLSVVAVGVPGVGSTTTNGSTVLYTPPLNFDGTTTFTYTVSDGELSDIAMVTVTMIPINDRPVAGDDSYTTNKDTQLVVNAPGVLDNDSDPESTLLTAVLPGNGPSNGNLSLNSDGSFTYMPAPGFSGLDSFTYRASDGTAFSIPATVSINVLSN